MPFFSIIVPTYNRAALIRRAIDSVLAQTFADWELIIVDDGSKDNTRQVVTAYTDPRIKYIYQQNAERCAARNNGISNSSGKYICFVDSDDYFLPNRLELLFAEMRNRGLPVGMFYTGLVLYTGQKLVNREENENIEGSVFDRIALSTIHSQQTCISRQILLEHKYDINFHIGEDMELWLRIAAQYPFTYLPGQFTVVVVDHDDRSVNLARYNSSADQLRMLRYIFTPPHPGSNVSQAVKSRLLGTSYYGVAKFHIYKNKRAEALTAMCKALMADGKSPQLKFRVNVFLKLLTMSSMDRVRELIKF